MATAFDMMQPQFWTMEQLQQIAQDSGYATDDWLDIRYIQTKTSNIVFQLGYQNQIEGEYETGYVYVSIDENNDLTLEF